MLPTLSGLVSKSVITVVTGPGGTSPGGPGGRPPGAAEPRYRMLETIRAYGLERLAEAGEESSVKDAFARYYLDLAETADPLLRTADQVRWHRVLIAEHDNANAALRWVIQRGDAESALRLVRSLGYYWVQLGHGEGDILARQVLAMALPSWADHPPQSPAGPAPGDGSPALRIAEARVICALIAAGWTWDVELVRGQLTEAIANLRRQAPDFALVHPLVALAEPIMALYDGDQDRALALFNRYLTAPDPWMRAMARLYRSSYGSTLGTMEGTEEDCRGALEEFRALGDKWGMAITLAQLAELTELRGDHAAAAAALEESAQLGRELDAWGDLPYIQGRLAPVWARAGDLPRAWAEWERAERAAAGIDGYTDSGRWLGLMRAEIAWRAGDLADATRCCLTVLDGIKDVHAAWWQGLRAMVKATLAMIALAQAEQARCRDLLREALDAAAGWVERPPLAVVIDVTAAYALSAGAPEEAARLLGAAHAIRGAFDESSPHAPGVRAAARQLLGDDGFEAAYQQGRATGYDAALALVRETLA